jgi:predicted small lipoprotein YifL
MAMTTRFKILALLGLCLSVTLTGCGRKGGLDDPSAAASQAETAVDPAIAPAPPQTEPPESEKSFPLDFLIR